MADTVPREDVPRADREVGPSSPPARPSPSPGRTALLRHPAVAPVTTLLAGLLGAVYLYGTNPHLSGQWLPRCPFNLLTGWDCPSCGGTRMTYDLLHGDWSAAFHDNPALLVLGVPAALWFGGRWVLEGLRGRRYRPRLGVLGTTLVLGTAVVWAVVRNVAGLG